MYKNNVRLENLQRTANNETRKSESLKIKKKLQENYLEFYYKEKLATSRRCFVYMPSRKLLRIKETPDLHLTYSKNGGNLGLELKMKNIAFLPILLTKHVKYTYLYLFKFVLYSIVAFKAN